ncbi:uncharacterized protein LOC100830122 [Brachypodium distachyon]|uniref:FLZ-type domain-containing protein n=1 Tax=Brachypodium distachyon TaxID=15368 RepID=A0A0Q3QGE9_BRADI|nr:uncharacterized protein LOC100830122 [Brachypodium distachyon]KQK00818.1 hypothetical protein BRADI_3g52016v3 [Brachypodium distachyon]|eukprot:XP_010235832.1 uncharacterized protein LOC100830122 [Brachypodium distachyon]
MEDYYCFPTFLDTASTFAAVAVHPVSARNRSSPSPRPRRVSRDHYLDACFRCQRILEGNKDIFMYRGDTPFCSAECRQQQIDSDEAAEKRSKQSAAARSREQQRQRQSARLGSVEEGFDQSIEWQYQIVLHNI